MAKMNLLNTQNKNILCLILGLFILHKVLAQNNDNPDFVIWHIDNVDSIDGNKTDKLGNPLIIDTPKGKAVWFDGVDDGLVVESNPLEGIDSAFTIEVFFSPDSSYPENQAQRFIHFQNQANDNRRVLIETRLTDDHQWYLDTYLKSENSSLILRDESAVHPFGDWYHAALVYDHGKMENFVNGVSEISGKVEFLPINNGQTSIGTRMNKIYWYKGAIQILKVTAIALTPEEFMINNTTIKSDLSPSLNFRLLQNYPNPFNPSTKITYSINKSSHVLLSVYNSLGQKVTDLFKGYQNPGNHTVPFNAKGIASGVYYYKIQAGKFVDVKRMLMIK